MIKRKMILLGFVLIIVIIVISIFCLKNKNYQVISQFEEIKEKLNNKEDILIYVMSNEDQCYECLNTNFIIQYYEDVYGLSFYQYNISNNTNDDFKKLQDEFDFEENILMDPAVILIKQGQILAVANFVLIEDTLKEYLVRFGFLEETVLEKDIPLNLDTFDPIYESSSKNLIVSFGGSKENYQFRKKIFDLSNEYHFSFYTLFMGIGNTNSIYDLLESDYGAEMEAPSLFIVKDKKVIDYLHSNQEKKILSFLRKNGIII